MKTGRKYDDAGDGHKVYLSPSDTREKIRKCLSCDIPQRFCDGSGDYEECRKKYEAMAKRTKGYRATLIYTPRADTRTVRVMPDGGSAIREKAREEGISGMTLAQKAGVTIRSDYYQDAFASPPARPRRISLKRAEEYARVLGCDVWDLVEREASDETAD